MNLEHKNIKPALHDDTPIPERKAYNAPSLHDLDSLKKTETGTQPFVFESLNGALTS
jgi:hypothetical protein